jgi:hypothetical protein
MEVRYMTMTELSGREESEETLNRGTTDETKNPMRRLIPPPSAMLYPNVKNLNLIK